jgi:hypothetical protein
MRILLERDGIIMGYASKKRNGKSNTILPQAEYYLEKRAIFQGSIEGVEPLQLQSCRPALPGARGACEASFPYTFCRP